MSDRGRSPVEKNKQSHLADVSPEAQARLLDVAFSRVVYGFGAMIIVGLPFIAWCIREGQKPVGLIAWTGAYIFVTPLVRWVYRVFCRDLAELPAEQMVGRWLPRVHVIAFVYGLSMSIPPLLTGGQAAFEFQLLYLVTVAAIVAGNAAHQSQVISVFRYFFAPAWLIPAVLLLPYSFPAHWYYVLPLTLVYIRSILKHANLSHQFFLQNVVLQEEGKNLADKYRLAKDEAEKALHDKNMFLATASHDLRQPVHAMGFLIESIAHRNNDAVLTPALDDLRRSVQSVTLMFNSLLDLSKIESKNIEVQFAPVALNPLMRDVAALFQSEAESRGLRLTARMTHHGAAVVLADGLLLQQSLINLVHNALRYTVTGGVLVGARRRGDAWRLEVWDTGIGIASTEEARMYSPFYRHNNAWRIDSAGHGLGLAVVARCAGLMRATYGFESIENRGSRFWLQLPATAPRETGVLPQPKRTKRQAVPLLQGKVLVVDDDPYVVSAWRSLMTAWGVEVRCVASAAAAYAIVDAGFVPQAILCDQGLRSGDSGVDVLKALFIRCPDASGAMVSGEFASPELKLAEQEGYLVLRKPLEVERLYSLLSLWLLAKNSVAAPN